MTQKIPLLGNTGRPVGDVWEKENLSSGTIVKKRRDCSCMLPPSSLALRTDPHPKLCLINFQL